MASLLKRVSKATKQQLSKTRSKATDVVSNISADVEERLQLAASVNYDKYLEHAVILDGKAFKRRSGRGKRSKRNAGWEKRWLELRGTALLYYSLLKEDNSEEMMVFDDNDTNNADDDNNKESGEEDDDLEDVWDLNAPNDGQQQQEESNQKKKKNDKADKDMPRGHIDLVEEKASVHASMGHLTGAPSPFCLSIQVNEQTKWKLAFDDNQTQMMWLAALTNIIVQSSVDGYNVQLLHAANPSRNNNNFSSSSSNNNNNSNVSFLRLRKPPVYEPPSSSSSSTAAAVTEQATTTNHNHTSSGNGETTTTTTTSKPSVVVMIPQHHQLWLTQDYIIRSSLDEGVQVGKEADQSHKEKETPGYSEAVAKIERQHQLEIQQRDAAYYQQLQDLQTKIVQLTIANAEATQKHNKEIRDLQSEMKDFARMSGGGGSRLSLRHHEDEEEEDHGDEEEEDDDDDDDDNDSKE